MDEMHRVRYVRTYGRGKRRGASMPCPGARPRHLRCPPTPKPSEPCALGILWSLHHEGMINHYLHF